MKPFLERIKEEVLVCDGAMGTMLANGQKLDKCFEELNLSEPLGAPSRVLRVHTLYAGAGAQILETNTFGANEVSLAKFELEDKVEEINKKAVKIARQASNDREIYIAGAVGPANNNGSFDVYKRQISALAEAGADLIMIETMHSIEGALNAITAAKSVSKNLPVVAQIACDEKFRTKSGVDAETFFRILNDSDADVLGLNCKIGPKDTYYVVEQARKWTTKPLSLQPNGGDVIFSEQEFYVSTDGFERYTRKFIDLGARIIGGCCGTTPAQIRVIANAVKERQQAIRIKVEEPKSSLTTNVCLGQKKRSALETRLEEQKPFPLVEIDPPRIGNSGEGILKLAKGLYDLGVKYFTIADNPGAVPRMDNIAFATLLLQNIPEAEIVMHMACRDLSLITAESKISGLGALGILNVLAITGDPPSESDYDKSIAVHNFQSISLIRYLKERNCGRNAVGKTTKPSNFYIGCAFDCGRFGVEQHRLKTKYLAGANFALTQIISDAETVKQLAEFAAEARQTIWTSRPFYTIPGVYLFRSASVMDGMQKPPFRIKIVEETLKEMQGCRTPKEEQECGYKIAKEVILEAKKHFPAVYIIPPAKKPDAVIPLLRETGLV